MKKPTVMLAVFAALAASASAEPVAYDQANLLAGGAPARAVMDGGSGKGLVLAQATTAGGERAGGMRRNTGASLFQRAAPPAPRKKEPGFFSKAWAYVKTPGFYVPAGGALTFGAMGAMMAGPLGALTGAIIGGLLGFIVSKALGE